MDKVAKSLLHRNWNVVLVGRKLNSSLPISREYQTRRITLLFNRGFLFYAEYNFRLFFYLLFKKCDVLHANDLDTLLAVWLAAKFKRKPIIYDSHEYFLGVPEIQNRRLVKFVWQKIEEFIFPKLQYVFTVNLSIAELYKSDYGLSVNVLRNLPENKQLNHSKPKAELNLPEDKPIVILQGSGINVDRGAEELLEAIAIQEELFLCVVGKGDVFPQLKLRARAGDLKDKTLFVDAIPYEDMMQYTMHANVGLSLDKGNNLNYKFSLPNKLFDYLKAGIPVVSSDLIEIRHIIEKYKCGVVVNSHEPKAILNAIKEAIQASSLLSKGVQNAQKELSWENEVMTLLDCYEQIGK